MHEAGVPYLLYDCSMLNSRLEWHRDVGNRHHHSVDRNRGQVFDGAGKLSPEEKRGSYCTRGRYPEGARVWWKWARMSRR